MPPQDANPTPSFGGFGLSEVILREGSLTDFLRENVDNGPCWLLIGNRRNVPTQIGLCYID